MPTDFHFQWEGDVDIESIKGDPRYDEQRQGVQIHQNKEEVQAKRDCRLVSANTFMFGSLEYWDQILLVQTDFTANKSSELHVTLSMLAQSAFQSFYLNLPTHTSYSASYSLHSP